LEVFAVMIEKRTVFILGAGASCPYGFPTARQLRKDILAKSGEWYGQYVHGFTTEHAFRRIDQGYPDQLTLEHFVQSFRLSSTESIDLFLSRNPQLVKMGKMAICLAILKAEKQSHFREDVEKPERDWYFYLYNRLTRGFATQESYCCFPQSNVAFITFNYDRSLEHFLFESVLHSCEGIDSAKAKEIMSQIPIIHVYGQVGGLGWQAVGPRIAYGGESDDFSQIDLLSVIENLYVVHEERVNPELERAREVIKEAERIFFLGFGYAKENFEVLGFPDVLNKAHRVSGTAMDSTSSEIQGIESYFRNGLVHSGVGSTIARTQVRICGGDCVQLLRDFL
jgi:hypothetical protein